MGLPADGLALGGAPTPREEPPRAHGLLLVRDRCHQREIATRLAPPAVGRMSMSDPDPEELSRDAYLDTYVTIDRWVREHSVLGPISGFMNYGYRDGWRGVH